MIVDWIIRQESYFAYLFGVIEPGFCGAIVSSFCIFVIAAKYVYIYWCGSLCDLLIIEFIYLFIYFWLFFLKGYCDWKIYSICS